MRWSVKTSFDHVRGGKRLSSLIAVVLLAALAASPIYGQTGRGGQGLETAIAAQEWHTDALLANPGVVGTAVGYNADGVPVVKIYIETAGVTGLPKRLDGVPVVVQVTGRVYALHHRPGHSGGPGGGGDDPTDPEPDPGLTPTDRWPRPVPIGVSTGHPNITAGTIGARVTDGTDVYALSNNHVYANENNATIGDNVLQPGSYDGGTDPDDAFGTLSDFEPIVFDALACDPGNLPDPDCNTIDAAIAISSTDDLGNATPSDGYGTPKSATMAAFINQKVKKYGRTTSETKGRVSAINATVNVGYGSGVARFVNQIIIEPGSFSAGGDSGSLVVVDGKGKDKAHDRRPVGLLFAGSVFITVANPIDLVLDRFGVTVDGE